MNRQYLKLRQFCATVLATLCITPTAWADLESDILGLQTEWARLNYAVTGKDQISAFEVLISKATALVEANPKQAEPLIWSGIIKSTLAGAKGGLGALSLAKDAKRDLEKSLTIDFSAMQGSALTSLGTLYLNVPGWPIGFGSDNKAEDFLRQAIAMSPEGIDSNYFYAEFLVAKGRMQEAVAYFIKAQNAAPRHNRPLADSGRQQEIAEALKKLQ